MSEINERAIAKTFTLKVLPNSEVELVGEVPFDAVEAHRKEAIAHIGEKAEFPGFRKGHVPESVLVSKMGEIAILEEAVEHVISHLYPALVEEHKLDAIGRPTVAITKLAPGNPVGLTIRTAIFPIFELPDYKKLASVVKEETPAEVSEDDVKNAIGAILQSRSVKKEGTDEMVVPEMSDDFVRTLGEFETVADFTEKLKGHLATEKVQSAKEKRRLAITEAIMEKTSMEIPLVFVASEQEKMIAQMKDDIKRFGMTFEDYLKRVSKTEEVLKGEFEKDAEKRAKLQLILNAIAEKEEIKIPAEEIEKEAKHILEHFGSADRERVHIYVESVQKNEKVLQMLEGK